jgi:glycosyltransferase involved in cell wall biosynthesis
LPDGFAAVLLGREFRIPVLCTAHGSDIYDYPFRNRATMWATRWTVKRVDGLVAVNSNLKSRIAALGRSGPVTVSYNGADQQVFSQQSRSAARAKLGIPASKKVVVFVGYLCPEKGLEHLLAAMKQLVNDDTILYLVGDGVLREQLQAQAVRFDLGNTCVFVGQRPHSEIAAWLSAADCFVLPSVAEGFPLVIVEAMASRAPIVATAVGGIPEIVRHEHTGLLVPPRDPGALANAMNRILCDRDFADVMAARAKLVASRFTWNNNAQQTLAAYKETVAEVAGYHQASSFRSVQA